VNALDTANFRSTPGAGRWTLARQNNQQSMKRILSHLMLAGLAATLAWTITPALHAQSGQGDQIKKKAKDFKKQVEGEQAGKTNAPAKKPPQAPQKSPR
jgi:hypothetical protein